MSAERRGADHAAARALARLTRLVERSTGELSLAHYRVLAAVADGDERASRLAQRLALGKPAISASVEALCTRGLLERGAVDGDLRATALSLTERGRASLDAVDAALAERLDELTSRTPDPAATLSALAALGGALDELGAERLAKAAR